MNKKRIKLLVPHLSGRGLVWEQFVQQLAKRDDMEFWASQKTEQQVVAALPFTKPRRHYLSMLLP